MRRATVLDNFVPTSLETGGDAPSIGHAAGLLTRGFEGRARLVRLLVGACRDLADQVGSDNCSVSSAVYLSVPDACRPYSDLELVRSKIAREARRVELSSFEPEPLRKTGEWLWGKSASILRWPSTPKVAFVSTGHTGFTAAIRAALADIDSRGVKSALVAAVDSLLDLETIVWLHETGRLKNADMPIGVEPGEAAACLLLEVDPPKGRPFRTLVSAPHVEPAVAESTDLLERAILGSQRASRQETLPSWVFVDLDGTEGRAAEWGRLLVRLCVTEVNYDPRMVYPAISFGDVGSAFGALSTCMAIAAWDRGYATRNTALIVSGDRGYGRAAHVLRSG